MTREEADKVVWERLANELGMRPLAVGEYWVTSIGLRVRLARSIQTGDAVMAEHTLRMPRAEAQALVDAGGE